MAESQQGAQPLVTIIVPVFNQERYIEQCLRSIAMQKVDFPYEVLVGDDHSTDSTQEVLIRLRDELPDSFHFLLREQNMGGRGEKNCEDMLLRSRGKYLALLEGDDYWTYDGKLQAQVDFLEAHPDYSSVFHRCTVVGEDSLPNGEAYPQCPTEDYTYEEFFYCSMPGQLGTCVMRRQEFLLYREEFMAGKLYDSYAGDRRNAFVLLMIGKVRCLPDVWSAYRHVKKGGASYSANVHLDRQYAQDEVDFAITCMAFAMQHDNPEALRTAKLMYHRVLFKWSHGEAAVTTPAAALRSALSDDDWPAYLTAPLRWYAVLGARQLMGQGVTL